MKLVTQELLHTFITVGSQEEKPNPILVAKYFCPWNQWAWYATEYNPETKVFFGVVEWDCTELGYFSLDELEEVQGPYGLRIERDIHFKLQPLSEVFPYLMGDI